MFQKTFVWAHRGASRVAPENTLAAFRRAEQAGADGLEFDVHLSRDGVPVVIHDESLDRTTDACGPVSALSWDQLQRLDAGSWFSADFAGEAVPNLVEVLRQFAGRLRLNIEIKDAAAGAAVLETLADFPSADVLVSSFAQDLLQGMRRLRQGLPLAVLYEGGNWRRALRLAIDIKAQAFHPDAAKVNRPLLAACRSCHLPVHVWTLDDVGRVRSLQRAGIAGFFTNDPACFTGC